MKNGVRRPDFVVVSFYKIFGYPTGLGALLVRREAVGGCDHGGGDNRGIIITSSSGSSIKAAWHGVVGDHGWRADDRSVRSRSRRSARAAGVLTRARRRVGRWFMRTAGVDAGMRVRDGGGCSSSGGSERARAPSRPDWVS